jgi:hypothetical protein
VGGILIVDFSLLEQRPMIGWKGGKALKTMKSVLSVLVLAGAMSSHIASAVNADGVILKDASTEGSYCHMKFPAIQEQTLGTARPLLKEADSGDVIDFYGSCSHDPLGKEEVQVQLRDLHRRRAREYMD